MAVYHFSMVEGNDDHGSGTQSSPFQTLDKANAIFSSAIVAPGDHFLFAMGETFFGKLEAIVAGTADKPIKIGTYVREGSAYDYMPARFCGGIYLIGAWERYSSGGVEMRRRPLPGSVSSDVLMFRNLVGRKCASVSAISNDYDWTIDSNYIYIYASADPWSYYGIKPEDLVLVTKDSILAIGAGYIEVERIRFQHWNYVSSNQAPAVNIDGDTSVIKGISIHDCEILAGFNLGSVGISVQYAEADIEHNHFDRPYIGISVRDHGTVTSKSNLFSGVFTPISLDHVTAGGTSTKDLSVGGMQTFPTDMDTGTSKEDNRLPFEFFVRPSSMMKATLILDDPFLAASDYSRAGKTPIVLPDFLNTILDIFDRFGQKYPGLGVVSARLAEDPETWQGAIEFLREFHDKGGDIVNHSWSHTAFISGSADVGLYISSTLADPKLTIQDVVSGSTTTRHLVIKDGTTVKEDLNLSSSAYKYIYQVVDYLNAKSEYTVSPGVVTYTYNSYKYQHSESLALIADVPISSTYGAKFSAQKFAEHEIGKSYDFLTDVVGTTPSRMYAYPFGQLYDYASLDTVFSAFSNHKCGRKAAPDPLVTQNPGYKGAFDMLALPAQVFTLSASTESGLRDSIFRHMRFCQRNAQPAIFFFHPEYGTEYLVKAILSAILELGEFVTPDELYEDFESNLITLDFRHRMLKAESRPNLFDLRTFYDLHEDSSARGEGAAPVGTYDIKGRIYEPSLRRDVGPRQWISRLRELREAPVPVRVADAPETGYAEASMFFLVMEAETAPVFP